MAVSRKKYKGRYMDVKYTKFSTSVKVPGVDGSLKKKYKVRYVDVVKCKKFSTSFKVPGVEHQFMCLLLMAVSRKRL